jgi:hypothetical protein
MKGKNIKNEKVRTEEEEISGKIWKRRIIERKKDKRRTGRMDDVKNKEE